MWHSRVTCADDRAFAVTIFARPCSPASVVAVAATPWFVAIFALGRPCLAVATGCGQLKSGAPARGERVAKYNRLLAIDATESDLPYGVA